MKKTLLLVALAFAVLVPAPADAASCTTQTKTAHPVSKSLPKTYKRANTWVYGDSITWQSRTHLRASLPGVEAIDAYWGRNTNHAVNALLRDVRAARKFPRTLVMAVGTNDMTTLDAFRHEVDRTLRIVPRSTRIVWVNAYSDTDPNYNIVHRILREHSSRVKVVNWAASNAPTGASPLLYDGLHVNDRGCTVRNSLIRKAVVR